VSLLYVVENAREAFDERGAAGRHAGIGEVRALDAGFQFLHFVEHAGELFVRTDVQTIAQCPVEPVESLERRDRVAQVS
jgi:hypothetical protein